MTAPRHILILGGGITGLAAAHRVQELAAQRGVQVRATLLEAGDHLGGAIRTIKEQTRHGEFLVELGPDNFITNKPGAISLCKRLKIDSQLISTSSEHRRALVVRRGKLVPIPEGFELMAPRNMYAMAISPIFSLRGKLRMWCEQFVRPRKDAEDESLESFVVRRFGREALDRLIQPLIGGIYTADPAHLSLRATVPRFLDMETNHGSIIRAIKHEKKQRLKSAPAPATATAAAPDSGARYSLFMTLRDGMTTLVDVLATSLDGVVHRNRAATAIKRNARGLWQVDVNDGESIEADAVLFATPARVTSSLLKNIDEELSRKINTIEFASSALVVMAFRRDQVHHPLDAFGFVVPAIEKRSIIAGSFSHVKYAGRAPEDCVLLRAFIGGATQAQMMSLSDEEMVAAVEREFGDLLGTHGSPVFAKVQRWPQSMPQYAVGHVKLVESIRVSLSNHAGLGLAGSGYDGVGIPDCITSGENAIDQLMAQM